MTKTYAGDMRLKTADEGAATPVWLVLGDDLPGTGRLFGNDRAQLDYAPAAAAPAPAPTPAAVAPDTGS